MHGCKACRAVWFLCLWILLCAGQAFAQVVVKGTVVDPDGAAVPQLGISLSKAGSTSSAGIAATTDAEGRFHFPAMSAGDYEISVPAAFGFEAYTQPLHVLAGMHDVRIQLSPSNVTQDVTVAPENGQVTLDAAGNRDQMSTTGDSLERLPVFDQDYIAALTPFLDQSGVATMGATIVVDGIEMKSTGVSASAIAEARINNDPYSVETSRPGRGRIEIMTKPAQSALHGTLNFTFRDASFDARNYFAASKPFEQKRIYEGSLTGPVPVGKATSFLVSGSRQEDNLQSVVHAVTLGGLVNSNVPTPTYTTQFAVRVAHDFSPAHRASLQYNVEDTVFRNMGAGGLILPQAGTNGQSREDDVIFNDRIILSPTLLNQLQLFYEKDHNPTHSAAGGQKIVVDGAFTGGGAQADLLNTENNAKINDIVSWTHKNQYIKFGVNIPNLSRRRWEDQANRLGTYSFSSLTDYAAGTPYSFTQQTGPGSTVFWMNEIGTFFADQIQLRPNLQISVGIRYDWQTYFKSVHDFAPRGSVAYSTADRKTVIRAGAGVFYDRSGAPAMADLKRFNGVVLRAFTLLNPSYPQPYAPGTNLDLFPTNLVVEAPGTRIPYVFNESIGIERQLPHGLTIAGTYRGTLGIAMFLSRDANAPLPPSYNQRPDLQLGVVRQIESEGRQSGHAIDLTLNSKSNRWFSGMLQYTLSRTNNNTGGITWFPANQYSMQGEYARADFDQRHRVNVLAVFHQDHWLNLGVAAKIYSGTPFTETSGQDTFNTGLLNARPAGVNRNTLQTAGTEQLDLRWSHGLFPLHQKAEKLPSFTLAIDAFNITNHTNYTTYVGNVQSPFFDQPTAALPARRIQFTGRIKF